MLDEERRMYAVALRKSTAKVGELQAQLDRKPAEPRPMSEAPKSGTEIALVMRALYVRGMGWVVDRDTAPSGWLPTPSDEPSMSGEVE